MVATWPKSRPWILMPNVVESYCFETWVLKIYARCSTPTNGKFTDSWSRIYSVISPNRGKLQFSGLCRCQFLKVLLYFFLLLFTFIHFYSHPLSKIKLLQCAT